MALTKEPDQGLGQRDYSTAPDKYTSLDNLVDGTREDVRDIYAAIYGDQGLSGLVEVIGAKKSAGTADETVWYEEGRLGRTFTTGATAGQIAKVDDVANTATETDVVRVNDVVLAADGKRYLITEVSGTTISGKDLNTANGADVALPVSTKYAIIGNAYAQGTNQPTKPFAPRLTRRRNPFTIVKESFHVTGSQASNVGYVNVGGQNMWYLKGELDARRKFLNMREAMLVFSQNTGITNAGFQLDGTGASNGDAVPTSEGFFDAVEDRGGVATDCFNNDMDAAGGFDEVIIAIDKQGAPLENALYLNKTASVKLDNLLGTAGLGGDGIGAMSAFGAFNNDRDMAIQMGFQSFTKGGYTFHKHDWKLLNDPSMGGVSKYQGGLIPLSQIVDMKTGNRHHSLEMNYKAAGNYSRELEHWVEGGGVLGFNTGGEDLAKFNYRSECNLCVRGANQFFAFKTA